MDFTARLSGMAQQAGMTQAQVMGLASVMDQSMVNAEEGSTALNRLIQELYTKPSEMAKAVGLDVKHKSPRPNQGQRGFCYTQSQTVRKSVLSIAARQRASNPYKHIRTIRTIRVRKPLPQTISHPQLSKVLNPWRPVRATSVQTECRATRACSQKLC